MAANQQVFRQFTLRGLRVTENELGHGSYAVVLELEYQGLKCAGKKLYRVLYESVIGHAAQRYLEECQLLSQIRHPHIVQFIGVCFEEGSQFPILVMEFLPTNLSSCLDRYGILSDEISYSIIHDVSLGLSYLHSQTPPIVHRDLSANNVLLSKDMTAKISDLGVARILNLSPLQVSRMTGTPGTPAYMPPEVMVANPRYDTSVDVFSFGVMMIHTFTAEWPLPSVGPSRVDPINPDRVIAVTEAERREVFLRKIARDHPLMDLIVRCLSNNPQRRPPADEIVGRMGGVVLQYPPSFENTVEMLQQISTLNTQKTELEQEIERKVTAIEEKGVENEQLSEKKIQQTEENESTIKRLQLASSVEVNQKVVEIKHLKSQLEAHQVLIEELRAQNDKVTTQIEQQIVNAEFTQKQMNSLRTQENTLTAQVNSLTVQVAALTEEKATKESSLAVKDTVIASREAEIAARESSLQASKTTIQSLNKQLEKTQNYLATKLQVQLSYNQCLDAPEEMTSGIAITINDKLYYGGGCCSSDDDEYSIHCYTTSQCKWSTLPELPVYYFGMGKVNNKLVTVGGNKRHYSQTNEVYVLAGENKWKQTIPPMPTARESPAVISTPTHLIVVGGGLSSDQPTDIVEIYNINNSQWSMTDTLPYVCNHPRTTTHKNTVYLLGGWDGVKHLNKVVTAQVDQLIANSVTVEVGSVNNDSDNNSTWKEITSTPLYRSSAVTVSGMVLAIGGVDDANPSACTSAQGVYAYSSSMDSWVYISDLPSPIAYAATVSLSLTQFLVISGYDEDTRILSTVHKGTITISV